MSLLPGFLVNAVLAGLGVALVAGPLGPFVVWRRMAYLGDTLAHAALLGVALGLALSVNPNLSVMVLSSALALFFVFLERSQSLATDTLLGILAHSTLALGLVVVALQDGGQVNLYGYLFGDLLAIASNDLLIIYGVAALVLAILFRFWRSLLAITVHEELARVEGVNVPLVRSLLMVTLALTIAVAMKAVGVLLITALLIIPAAAARPVARSPEQMAVMGTGIAGASVLGGLAMSYLWDSPAGPSVVLCAGAFFLLSLAVRRG